MTSFTRERCGSVARVSAGDAAEIMKDIDGADDEVFLLTAVFQRKVFVVVRVE